MPAPILKIGEATARIILAIGAYQDFGMEPGYGDLARATGRSLSRIRTIVSEVLRKYPDLIVKVSENPVKLRLSENGLRIYQELKMAVMGDVNKVVRPHELVKLFESKVYTDNKQVKLLGSIGVVIDTVIPTLKIEEIITNLRNEVGSSLLFGLSLELATAAQLASYSKIGTMSFTELSRQVINVPIRIARITDISLPPHIEGTVIPLDRALGTLRSVTVWPDNSRTRDAASYAEEADALGLIKVIKGKTQGEVYLQPRLDTGIHVIDRISSIGFDVLASNPTRAWIPVLTVYGDVTREFPTLEQVQSGETRMLKILSETVSADRVRRWVDHLLGLQRNLKIPALVTGAQYETLGVIHIVKVGDEKRLLSFTVARRLLGESFGQKGEEKSIREVYDAAERKIKTIFEEVGIYACILREFINKGFVEKEDALKIAEKCGSGNPERDLKELESLGFISSVGIGYYSAWTITPIYNEQDDTRRTLLAWLSKELRNLGEEMWEVARALAERGEVSLTDLDKKSMVRVLRGLATLEKMGLIQFVDDETVKITSENEKEARRLLTMAVIEHMLGINITDIHFEPNKRVDLKEVVASLIEEK